jgi:endonuclease III
MLRAALSRPFELLMAVILSAQSTDASVNRVSPALFARFPDARALAAAPIEELEAILRPIGFFRAKARSLVEASQRLVEEHDGLVPGDLESLVQLRGVGRKTANVVLGECFGVPGITVDTHVRRLSRRMGLTAAEDPERIEQELGALLPRESWTLFSHRMIWHGRNLCPARRPLCERCPVRPHCPTGGANL